MQVAGVESRVVDRGVSIEMMSALLGQLGPVRNEVVVVGGQAVAWWTYYYASQLVTAPGLVTSMDIDFCADTATVKRCGEQLNVVALLPGHDEVTLNSGRVNWQLNGQSIGIDFLSAPFGRTYEQINSRAVEIEIPTIKFGPISIRMMHPVDCVRTRVCNVSSDGGLGRDSEHSLRQLRASIAFTRAFLVDQLDQSNAARGDIRDVLACNEELLKFCYFNRHAKAVYLRHAIDPLDAITLDARLPEKFISMRYPRFTAKLGQHRASYAAHRAGRSPENIKKVVVA